MPIINSYGSLKIELSGSMYTGRFAANYDRATQDFEAVANRRLRVRQMETSTLLTTVDGDVALPIDYLLWRTVLWSGRSPFVELDYVHPAYLRSTWIETDHGNARVFTIEGGRLKARPVHDDPNIYEFHYYQKIPTIIGSDNNSNWLITEHPDLYLEGVLTELFILSRNGEAALAHKQLRDEKLAEVVQLSALTTGATSPSVRTAEYF